MGVATGLATRGNFIAFGKYALQALQSSRVSARQIEAGRRAITRTAGRSGKLWVRVVADKDVTVRPLGVRMGSGKGPVAYKAAEVKAGRILYEIGGVAETIAREAMKVAGSKMPVRTRFIMLK